MTHQPCRSCGHPVDPAFAFCGSCGHAVPRADGPDTAVRRPAAPPTPSWPGPRPAVGHGPATPWWPPEDVTRSAAAPVPPARRGRTVALAVGAVCVLLLAGVVGVGLGVWTLGGDGADARDDAGQAAGGPAEVAPSGAAEPSEDVVDADGSASPDGEQASAGRPGVRCWSGGRADLMRACPAGPDSTLDAYRWVFPAVDFDACVVEPPTAQRSIYNCQVGDVELNFSRWTDTAVAAGYYRSNMRSEPRELRGGRLLWRGYQQRRGEGKFKQASMYADAPWSMTVYADSPAAADRARETYWMRESANLRGIDD